MQKCNIYKPLFSCKYCKQLILTLSNIATYHQSLQMICISHQTLDNVDIATFFFLKKF